jgi:hypothetical protein
LVNESFVKSKLRGKEVIMKRICGTDQIDKCK